MAAIHESLTAIRWRLSRKGNRSRAKDSATRPSKGNDSSALACMRD